MENTYNEEHQSFFEYYNDNVFIHTRWLFWFFKTTLYWRVLKGGR